MTTKKIKDYINKGVRHIKHRKGFGVHSPFAYSIITDVIEERNQYYAYLAMKRVYAQNAPISFKYACLLLRLANRFRSRQILEVHNDGGYSLLPLILTDSRNSLVSLANQQQRDVTVAHLSWLKERVGQVTFEESYTSIAPDYKADMILVSDVPQGMSKTDLAQWLFDHTHENTLILVKGIRPRDPLEGLWDELTDNESIEITMDLYDYGLAIRRPRFFKQHYIVSF